MSDGDNVPIMYAGKPLSWVKDDATTNIFGAWGAVYRDVVIVDPMNKRIEAYNLTSNDLQLATNRKRMKDKLIAASIPADTDGDRIPDYWEQWAYGSLTRTGSSIGSDGIPVLQHYAHCSNAPFPASLPGGPGIVQLPFDGAISITFIRRRGKAFGLTCQPELSQSLSGWSGTGHGYEEWNRVTLYDGSGGEVVEWRSVTPAPWPHARIRASLPQQ